MNGERDERDEGAQEDRNGGLAMGLRRLEPLTITEECTGHGRATALGNRAIALSTFANIERALEIDKLRSIRGQVREFMCIRDQVLVIECDKETMTETGVLHIPESAQGKQVEGVVIAAGPGRLDSNNVWIATVVQPGDRVLYGRYSGTEQKLRGKTVRLIREEEILGVMR